MGRNGRMAAVALAAATVAAAGCRALGKLAALPREPAGAVSELVLPSPTAGRFVTEKHFVTHWLVLGPFQFAEGDFGGDQQQAAADEEFMPNEGALDGTQPAPKSTAWKERDFRGDLQGGRVDFDALYNGADHAAAYAVCWLQCPEALSDATLLVGSDDYVKVWLNGRLVHAYKAQRRASEWDQDRIEKVALQKGYNRVAVKSVDVVAGWDFYLRFADKEGRPITVKAGKPAAPAR